MASTEHLYAVPAGQQSLQTACSDVDAAPGAPAAPPARPRRVLLVDDNRDANATLAELLRMLGHDVVTAENGPETLSLVDTGQRFDVALLDIGLPGMNGRELARLLRERFTPQAMRLVALSGHGRAQAGAGPQASVFDDHFVKPVGIDALLASIDKAGAPAD